jgi:hypothetical protein
MKNSQHYELYEIQIKTTRYYFTSTRMAIIKKKDYEKCLHGCGKLGPSFTTPGNIIWYSLFGKSLQFLKRSNRVLKINENICPHKNLYSN